MQIGLVRVDLFKRFASVLKKRIEGCRHTMALERLARSCGMKGYQQILDAATRRCAQSPLLEGSRDDLLAEWKRRLASEFLVDIASVLSADELDIWFGRVFTPRERLVIDRDGEFETVRHVVDPRLGAADWRDGEFRQWIQREVDRDRSPWRADFLDDDYDDEGEIPCELQGVAT